MQENTLADAKSSGAGLLSKNQRICRQARTLSTHEISSHWHEASSREFLRNAPRNAT